MRVRHGIFVVRWHLGTFSIPPEDEDVQKRMNDFANDRGLPGRRDSTTVQLKALADAIGERRSILAEFRQCERYLQV